MTEHADGTDGVTVLPSPEGLLAGLSHSVHTTDTLDPGHMSDIQTLADTLVERILVSEGRGDPEVRIQIRSGALQGAEVTLARHPDGQLAVHIGCQNEMSFQSAVQARHRLEEALQRTGDMVRIEIDSSRDQDADRRSRTSTGYLGDEQDESADSARTRS